MMTDLYQSEEAQQILQIAINRQAEVGELTRTQLYEIAAELNISPSDLEAAEQEWQLRKGESQERQIFIQLRRGKFKRRLARYVIVNGFLIVLDWLIFPGLSWSLYIALVFGIGVALDAWRTFQLDPAELEEAFQRWRQRRQLRRSVSQVIGRWVGGRKLS